MADSPTCESVYFKKSPGPRKGSSAITLEDIEQPEDQLEADIFQQFRCRSSHAIEEIHIDGNWGTLRSLIQKRQPGSVLLSIHQSLLALTFTSGSLVFLLRRGCSKMQQVLCGLLSDPCSVPVFVGATAAYEALLSDAAADVQTLAQGRLHCMHPLLIAKGETLKSSTLWERRTPRFAEPPEDLAVTLRSIQQWIETWGRSLKEVKRSKPFSSSSFQSRFPREILKEGEEQRVKRRRMHLPISTLLPSASCNNKQKRSLLSSPQADKRNLREPLGGDSRRTHAAEPPRLGEAYAAFLQQSATGFRYELSSREFLNCLLTAASATQTRLPASAQRLVDCSTGPLLADWWRGVSHVKPLAGEQRVLPCLRAS
ncbi:hypothetical protein Efla_000497 [Eimeria flavescens]